jgi:hypothetical protein
MPGVIGDFRAGKRRKGGLHQPKFGSTGISHASSSHSGM